MMRVMCGSNFNRDVETHMMEYLVRATHEGLYYSLKEGRPWHGANEDFANVYGNTRYILAMLAWYYMSGDPAWKERIDATVNKLAEIAIYKDDYAYFPNPGIGEWFSYGKDSGWASSTGEPVTKATGEHPVILYQGPVLRGLARSLEITDNPNIRKLGDRLIPFLKQSKYWVTDSTLKYVDGPSRAHWCFHFHGWLAG